ncbi:SDR family NAD(P)-dependent oxidoreductase [Kitasatospora sp. NPDC057500]|uniref:SDR family NAD(P)-dependent oxidoreductase n=1 Tax=Kitasatospora sp. NPDC057500 TaxID=3346151 RepID=UPI0036A2EF15
MESLLTDRTAVVYGAGSVGGAVARAFVREGARVFVAGRGEAALKQLAHDVESEGGSLVTARVDALDREAVDGFLDSVVERTGGLDISFCATSTRRPGGEQGSALGELSFEDFSLPIIDFTKAQFTTANAAAARMLPRERGVIMMMTAAPARVPFPYTAGFGPAWAAVEAFARTLAAELGPQGVRVLCLHSAGSPDAARSIETTLATDRPELPARKAGWQDRSAARNLLGRWPSLADVGNMAAFMASDLAAVSTGTAADLTGGMVGP